MNRLNLAIAFLLVGLASTTCAQDASSDPKTIGRIQHSMVWTGKEVLIWGGGSEGMFFNHGLRIDPVTKSRTALSDKGAPSGRWAHAAVWTGSDMIVWGGRNQFPTQNHFADGARYDPRDDVWKPISTENAPTGRSQMAAVWTGEEMIVWGGYGDVAIAWNTGAIYNPKSDKWRPMPTEGAPTARVEPLYAWTGKELLIWGGITPDLNRTFQSGARYNPTTDKWTPITSSSIAPDVWGSRAVWTGREMLIWGGSHRNGDNNINEVVQTGAAYDPATDKWRAMTTIDAPKPRFFHTAVWDGSKMVVWGGGDQIAGSISYNDGGEYDPIENRWKPLTWDNAPAGRGMHSAVWTEHGMVIFGGATGGSSAYADDALLQRR